MMTNEDDKEEIDNAVELRVYNGATLRTMLALRCLFFRTPPVPGHTMPHVAVQLSAPSEVSAHAPPAFSAHQLFPTSSFVCTLAPVP
jgi:hypothetical protein